MERIINNNSTLAIDEMPEPLADSSRSEKNSTIYISFSQLIGPGENFQAVSDDSNDDNLLNFNLILKNGSHFYFDQLKFYTCDKNNNSYLEFYYNMNLIYNLTNCPREYSVSKNDFQKELLLNNDFNKINKISIIDNRTEIVAIKICFENKTKKQNKCEYLFGNEPASMTSEYKKTQMNAFPGYEIIGFYGAFYSNQSKLVMDKFGIIMELKKGLCLFFFIFIFYLLYFLFKNQPSQKLKFLAKLPQ